MKTIKVTLEGKEVEETILEEDEIEQNEDLESIENTLIMEPISKGDNKDNE